MPLTTGFDDADTLRRILETTQAKLAKLKENEAVQWRGPTPPAGRPPGEMVRFTAQDCVVVRQHLRAAGLPCVRVLTDGHASADGYAVIAAKSASAVLRHVGMMRKTVQAARLVRPGLRLLVLDEPFDPPSPD